MVILNLVRNASVRVITWPAHTTRIFRALNISLFGVLKRRTQHQLPFDENDGITAFTLKTWYRFKQTVIEANTWGAFHEAGFEFAVGVDPSRIWFDAKKVRRNPLFQEMWALDFPFQKLSVRR
jgi:hypothetical protein